MSLRGIASELKISRDTIYSHLKQERPSDEFIEQAEKNRLRPSPGNGNLRAMKINANPDLALEFNKEAERQGCTTSLLGNVAMRLYLDVVKASRSPEEVTINVLGYIPQAS
jgi:hypothetical protein